MRSLMIRNRLTRLIGISVLIFVITRGHLHLNNIELTKGADVVCIFVNDEANAEVIDALVANGVKLLALRCAGYNKRSAEGTSMEVRRVTVGAGTYCRAA